MTATGSTDNIRGATWMTVGMFGYVVNDAMIKLAAEDLPLFEAIFLRGLVATSLLFVIAKLRGDLQQVRVHLEPPVLLRIAVEMAATVCYLVALTHMSISIAIAILQIVPLAVTLAAARFLGESVGWRRYLSVLLGFVGVLIIVRPGTDGFNAWTLLVVVAVCLIVVREMATRRVGHAVPSTLIALGTATAITVMAVPISLVQGWSAPRQGELLQLALAALFLTMGYVASVVTVRIGDISFTAPFRYTVMVFALVLQLVLFDDVPDALTLVGSTIIVGAGLYAFARERAVAARTAPKPVAVSRFGSAR